MLKWEGALLSLLWLLWHITSRISKKWKKTPTHLSRKRHCVPRYRCGSCEHISYNIKKKCTHLSRHCIPRCRCCGSCEHISNRIKKTMKKIPLPGCRHPLTRVVDHRVHNHCRIFSRRHVNRCSSVCCQRYRLWRCGRGWSGGGWRR